MIHPVVLSLLLGAASLSFAQQSAAPVGVPHPEMLVSTKWLADHLSDNNVVILHIADSQADFKRGHIPNARYLAMNKLIANKGDLNSELPAVEDLQKTFSELGIGDMTRVV